MSNWNQHAAWLGIVVVFVAGCAASPEVEDRRKAIEADIDEILSLPLDPAEYGEVKRCLSDMEFRGYRAIDDRHILFEGRRGKLWMNTLRGRCSDLRYGDVLVVRQFSSSRMCDGDQFRVTDWFDSPWYRRWPWQWGTGPICVLGKFQPVTEAQVEEIEARLEDW